MALVRVYELAKRLEVDSKDVLKALQDMGHYVRSARSTIEANLIPRLEERVLRGTSPRTTSTLAGASRTAGVGRLTNPPSPQARRSPRRTTPPPITRTGGKPPRPGPDMFTRPGPDMFKSGEACGRGVEVTEAEILRNLIGSGPLPPSQPRRYDPDRSGSRRQGDRNRRPTSRKPASRTIPIVPALLDEWELLLLDAGGSYAHLGPLQANAALWQTLMPSIEQARKWLRAAPSPADHSTILALANAGFTPAEAFRTFSPQADGRTTTPYLKVRGGKSAKEVRALFELAQQRRRAMGA